VPLFLAKVNGGGVTKLNKPFLFKREWQLGSTAVLHIGEPASLHAVWRFKW
jgi:hypothetical protein